MYQPRSLLTFQLNGPDINFNIALDQARSEPPSIVTLAVLRASENTTDRKLLAPTIVPGAHPRISHPIPSHH